MTLIAITILFGALTLAAWAMAVFHQIHETKLEVKNLQPKETCPK